MRWNSFTIIGILLILVGLFGLAKGPTFQFDPGLPSAPYTWLYYVIVGGLMIVNGLIVPHTQKIAAPDSTTDVSAEKKPEPQVVP